MTTEIEKIFETISKVCKDKVLVVKTTSNFYEELTNKLSTTPTIYSINEQLRNFNLEVGEPLRMNGADYFNVVGTDVSPEVQYDLLVFSNDQFWGMMSANG